MNCVLALLLLNVLYVGASFKPARRRQVQNSLLTPMEKSVIYSPVVIKFLVRKAKKVPRAKRFIACGVVQEVLKRNGQKLRSRFCLLWDSNRRLNWKPEDHISEHNSYIFSLQHDHSAHYTVFKATDTIVRQVKEILKDCPPSVSRTFPHLCGPVRIRSSLPNGVIHVNEGENLTLPCQPIGKTPFVREWKIPKKISRLRGSHWHTDIRYLQDGELFLGFVRENYGGNFTCEVRNALGVARKSYSVEIVSTQCGGTANLVVGQTNIMQTPNYPRQYPREKSCRWRFCPAAGKFLDVSFQTFSIYRGRKNRLLRRGDDKFSVHFECNGRKSSKRRSYCGKRSPGHLSSSCPSGCINFSFKSGFAGSTAARGFKASVTSVNKVKHKSEMQKVFCSSDFVLKAKTTVESQGRGRHTILEIYKASASTTGSNLLFAKHRKRVTDMFGCWMNIKGVNYLLGKRNRSGNFKIKYITKANRMPLEFIRELQRFKIKSPSC